MRSVKRLPALIASVIAMALTLGGCGFSVYDIPLPGGADTGKDPMTVHIQFADVLDLVPQSTVKVEDVTVGKVTKVELHHGIAVVTADIRRDTDLPANTRAEIQQTSLLGEKYVNLVRPSHPSVARLKNDATITRRHTGRNPEIEEVLGALSLILNGGGVAQLKTISTELNKALAGREDSARSVLNEVNKLMRNLDDHKAEIVHALEAVNKLSKSVRGQEKTIDATLDELPSAVASIDTQRKDLVTMLRALDRLGQTGVRVINASKTNTVAIVRDLQPVLGNLADSGDHLVNAFNTLLTYPFVDAAVGTTPQEARNTHYGDYVNLDITLNLNLQALQNLPDVGETVCTTLKQLKGMTPKQLQQVLNTDALCDGALKALSKCQTALEKQAGSNNPLSGLPAACLDLPKGVANTLSDLLGGLLGGKNSSAPGGNNGGGLHDLVCGALSALCRAPARLDTTDPGQRQVSMGQLGKVLDPSLVSLMMPGLDTSTGAPATSSAGGNQ